MVKPEYDPFNIDDVASYLDKRRAENRRTALVLGSRASALFRSAIFYEKMQQYGGSPSFERKSSVEKFKECYTLLTKKGRFTARDIDDILAEAVRGMKPSLADLYLAALILQGFFHVVISTSLDDPLWEALRLLDGNSRGKLSVYDGYDEEKHPKDGQESILLINVFGQLVTRHYDVQHKGYFEHREALKRLIHEHIKGDVLCLGYDTTWDAELGKLMHQDGGTFWYVNEEEPDFFPMGERTREIVSYVAPEWSYAYFIENLYPRCGGSTPVHSITQRYLFHEILSLKEDIVSLVKDIRTIRGPIHEIDH